MLPLNSRNCLNMIQTYPRNLFQKKNQHRWKSQQIKRSKETKWRIVIVGDKLIEPRKVDPLQDLLKIWYPTSWQLQHPIGITETHWSPAKLDWVFYPSWVDQEKNHNNSWTNPIYDCFRWLKCGNLNPSKPLESLNSSRKTACLQFSVGGANVVSFFVSEKKRGGQQTKELRKIP